MFSTTIKSLGLLYITRFFRAATLTLGLLAYTTSSMPIEVVETDAEKTFFQPLQLAQALAEKTFQVTSSK